MGFFSADIHTMDDLFVHTLRDIYYAENQIVKALPEESDAYFATRAWQSRVGAWASQQSEPVATRAQLVEAVRSAAARLGTPDVLRTVVALRERGVGFIESQAGVHPEPRGALTQGYLGGVMFELVHDERP